MVHIKHILCPVDFSDQSRHVFDRAMAVARTFGSDVTLLHVLPMPSPVPAVPFGPEGPGPFGFEVMDRQRTMAELSRFLGTERPGEVRIHQEAVEAPSVAKELLAQIARTAADLVVIGTHGRSGFNRLFLGSVAERVLRTSPVPVLIVPPRVADVAPEHREAFRSVICAVDFSRDSARALAYAASLAQFGGSRLTLVHVVEPLAVGYDPVVGIGFDAAEYHKAISKAAWQELQKAAAELPACGQEAVIADGKPYKEILRVAGERQADLIVVGVHGRNAIDRLVFGSTTEQLLRRSTCPVLTVRTSDPA